MTTHLTRYTSALVLFILLTIIPAAFAVEQVSSESQKAEPEQIIIRPTFSFPTIGIPTIRIPTIRIPTLRLPTPTPTPMPTATPRGGVPLPEDCVEAGTFYRTGSSGHTFVQLGPVIIHAAQTATGGPAHLSVVDCNNDGNLDVSVPWSESGAVEPAIISFIKELCDGIGPRRLQVTLQHGTPVTLHAYDNSGNLVDTASAEHGDYNVVDTLELNSHSGIRWVEIEGAEICILRICYSCEGTEPTPTPQGSVWIEPDMGVTFQQVNFEFDPENPVRDTAWGRVEVDPQTLVKATGLTQGFLNVYTDFGWVVQNLPLNARTDFDHFSSYFALMPKNAQEGLDVAVVAVQFSPEPQVEYQQGPAYEFQLAEWVWNAQGVSDTGDEVAFNPQPEPPLFLLSWKEFIITNDFIINTSHTQPNKVNVQTARNQCFPMAVANSLQYLEERFGLNVPHSHVPGLKGDDSLVGQLDTYADRTASSRTSGSGTWFTPMISGKFRYLADHGLADDLVHRYQGRGWGSPPDQALPEGDYTSSGITAIDDGDVVTWEWICEQIQAGEDVEICFSYDNAAGNPTGGHAVRVFECGMTLGVPWIGYVHDSNQSNDSAGLECVRVNLLDTDGDGLLNIGSNNWELRFAFSESVREEQKTPRPTATPTFRIIRPTFFLPTLVLRTPFPIITRTPTPTPTLTPTGKATPVITTGDCVTASDFYTAMQGGLSTVHLGGVSIHEALLPDGTPVHLSIRNCYPQNQGLEVYIPWSETNASPPAMIEFSSDICDGRAPAYVEVVLTHGTPVTMNAYDENGNLVDSETLLGSNPALAEVIQLSSPSGISRIEIIGAEICIIRICWSCETLPTPTPSGQPTLEDCVRAGDVYTSPADNLPTVNLGLVSIQQALLPNGTPVDLSVQDCNDDGMLDVVIPWSQTNAAQLAAIEFSPNICNGRAPTAVEVVLTHGTPVRMYAFDDDGNLVDSDFLPGSGPIVEVIQLTSASGIRRILIDGAEMCILSICWSCEEFPTPTPTGQTAGDECVDIQEFFNTPVTDLTEINLGAVSIHQAFLSDGTPVSLRVEDCNGDGVLDVVVPGSASPASQMAQIVFSPNLCQGNAPTYVEIVFTSSFPVRIFAYDDDGNLVDVDVLPGGGPDVEVVSLSSPSGIRRVRIDCAEVCITRICWSCDKILPTPTRRIIRIPTFGRPTFLFTPFPTRTPTPTTRIFLTPTPTQPGLIPTRTPRFTHVNYGELVLAQGYGGNTLVNIRNFNPGRGALTSIFRSFNGASGSFLEKIGGGGGRAVHLSKGDLDNDHKPEIVVTLGPIINDAIFPNIVIPRTADNRFVLAHSFMAFPTGDDALVNYNHGDIRSAVGDFIGSGSPQIAVAQGVGGNGIVRLYQYTGRAAPFGYEVVGQFSGLPLNLIALGDGSVRLGINIAAGDLDRDGRDELVVAQDNGEGAQTIFHVLDIGSNGSVERRSAFAAFPPRFRGEGGVKPAIADLNGDGRLELLFASQGNLRNYGDQRDTAPLNLVSVVVPVVRNRQIIGFFRPRGTNVFNVFSEEINPSGAISISAGDFNGNLNDGDELIFGTGAVTRYNTETREVTLLQPAPESRYRFAKIDFDGEAITNIVPFLGTPNGFSAFVGPFNPLSGAIELEVLPWFERPLDFPTPLPLLPDPIWVDDDNTTGIEDGSEENPFNTIMEAMNVAVDQTIRVKAGIYNEHIVMKDEVKLIGSGADSTIVDAGGSGTVVLCNNVSSISIISGFTFRNGALGIFCADSSPVIRENVIIGMDSASLSADGILLNDSSPQIMFNVIARVGGMGIRATGDSEPMIINNTIYDYGYYAGISFAALNIGAVTPLIKNNIVARGNTAPVGGILWSQPAAPVVDYNLVYDPANVTGDGAYYAEHDGTTWNEMSGGPGAISADPLFVDLANDDFHLQALSPAVDAGDPDPAFSDSDGSRNDMGAYGGQQLGLTEGTHPGSGFIFTSIGRIPVTEIVQDSADPSYGLADVSPAVASDLSIPQYHDSPFGGHLWIRGLFGEDDPVDYYKLVATSLDTLESFELDDPLTKTLYTINFDGTVDSTNIRLGPQEIGGVGNLYRLNKSGYWSQHDLRMIWNTTGLNGRYRLDYIAYQQVADDEVQQVTLSSNTLDHITLWIDSSNLEVRINDVFYADGSSLAECEDITFPHNGSSELIFNLTVHHPGGFLKDYTLDAAWGHNNFGGRFTADQYAGVHDVFPPLWSGFTSLSTVPLAPYELNGDPRAWEDCAYRFSLTATSRVTDGFRYLQWSQYDVFHGVETGGGGGGSTIASAQACEDCAPEDSAASASVLPLSPLPKPEEPAVSKDSGSSRMRPASSHLDIDDFEDFWYNVDPNTEGITKVMIERTGGMLTIHAYGSCSPHDCDWGEITVPYTGNPFTAVYEFGFQTKTLIIELVDIDTLHINSDSVFHDGTNRDYVADYTFRRSIIYVDDDNTSGMEDGTRAHPFNTIPEGLNIAVAGQSVRVMPGLYDGNLLLKDGVSVLGSGASETVIDSASSGIGVYSSGIGSGTIFAGFHVRNAEIGIYCYHSDLSILENIISNIDYASNSADGIRLDDSSPLIEHNVIHHVGGIGIRAQGDSEPGIINNTIYDYGTYSGISFASLDIGAVVPVIKNNIIMRANNSQLVGGILWRLPASPEISYNDVYDPANVTGTGSYYSYHDGTTWVEASGGPGAITADPMFLDEENGYFELDPLSPAVDAGDPAAIYNDNDGTRNDMGAYGGQWLNTGEPSHSGSGFVFTSIGKVPVSEIVSDATDPSHGLLRVSSEVASDLSIHAFHDTPFGGTLWIRGLFGEMDDVDYYQVLATPYGTTDTMELSDPLVKTQFFINPDGTVTTTNVTLGPLMIDGVSNLYRLNREGYWSFTDVRYIWRTAPFEGKYTLSIKAYREEGGALVEVALPDNEQDEITIIINNADVEVSIDNIAYADGTAIPECEKVTLPHNESEGLIFTITAWHEDGYLRSYVLDSYWGNNRFGGYFASEQYRGVHDSPPPFWQGVSNLVLPPLSPVDGSGNPMAWNTCAYRFRLVGTARITDGVSYLKWSTDNVYQSISIVE